MPQKKSSSSKIAAAQREYLTIKREYHRTGKLAMGKPSHSPAKREYCEIKREYHRAGKRLGGLTGRKTKR